jgi:23S rRNA (pseudouridine1915-N3)-methyltransferase
MEREARALREAVRGRGTMIALDRSGRQFGSRDLVRKLESWASPSAVFVIGGPNGLQRSLLEDADRVWSLSALTFPHELARVLVAEQLYRALTLMRGIPYHR